MSRLSFGAMMRMAVVAVLLGACARPASYQVITPVVNASPAPTLVSESSASAKDIPDEPGWCPLADAKHFATVPGGSPGVNWAVTSEYVFPADFWTAGEHEYTFWFEPCKYSGELPDHLTGSFLVTSEARYVDGAVYLGPLGVSVSSDPYGPFVQAVHPAQPAIAVLHDIQLTQADAEAVVRQCVVWISWDGGEKRQMTPRPPCRYEVR